MWSGWKSSIDKRYLLKKTVLEMELVADLTALMTYY